MCSLDGSGPEGGVVLAVERLVVVVVVLNGDAGRVFCWRGANDATRRVLPSSLSWFCWCGQRLEIK